MQRTLVASSCAKAMDGEHSSLTRQQPNISFRTFSIGVDAGTSTLKGDGRRWDGWFRRQAIDSVNKNSAA
jgi:hypothetical protein